jgi:hypothetical protein
MRPFRASFLGKCVSKDIIWHDICRNGDGLVYWDSNAFASEYKPPKSSVTQVVGNIAANTNASSFDVELPPELMAEKEKKMDADLDAFYADIEVLAKKEPEAPALPAVIQQQIAASLTPVVPKEDVIPSDPPNVGTLTSPPPPPSKSEPKKKPLDKKLQQQLEQWKSKQEEALTEPESDHEDVYATVRLPTDDDFANYDIKACMLCQRKFKSIEELRRHQSLSDMHKTKIQEHLERFCQEQGLDLQRVIQQRSWPSAGTRRPYRGGGGGGPKPKRPAKEKYLSVEEATRMYESQENGEQSSSKDKKEAIPDTLKEGIGSKLLQKMGWKEGAGLGRDESGIVNAINPETYTAGVGIGAGVSMSATTKAALAVSGYKERGLQLVSAYLSWIKFDGFW